MKDEDQGFRIVSCNPNLDHEQFIRLEEAYLELFNEIENLKYLSHSKVPLNSYTVSGFLKNAPQEGVEYYAAISGDDHDSEIIGISAFKNDLFKGFEIIGTVVHRNHRLKGVGKALIEKGILLANEKGFKAVDISVFADNKPMLILLIKMDFKPIRIESHARSDGEDLIYLKKYL